MYKGQRGYFTCYIGNRGYNWWLSTESAATLKTKEPNGLYLLEVHDPPQTLLPQGFQQNKSEFYKFRYFHGIFFALRRVGSSYMLTTTIPNHGSMFRRFIQVPFFLIKIFYFILFFYQLFNLISIFI